MDTNKDTPSSSTDEQLNWEELMTWSLEELEELLSHMYAALEENFHEICGYAQGAAQIEAQFQKLVGLEKQYQRIWEEIKVTVSAIIGHVVFSEQHEEEWKKLAHVLHEDMTFLQAVTSGSDITPQWLARRDALAAQTASLVKDIREEAVRQREEEKKWAFLLLLQDVEIWPTWKPSNTGTCPQKRELNGT